MGVCHVTVELTVEADDCKDAIELVEEELGADDAVSISWPLVQKVERGNYDA